MAAPHRRYAKCDEFKARGRSPSVGRPHSPRRRGSFSPVRHYRSPSRNAGRYSARSQSSTHSPPRYRNRSPSPPPRGNWSPCRARSRSPPPNYTIESPESRRRRLLTEKVMSLEMFHQLLLDSKSPWTRKSGTTSIPVPLASNENIGDYQQKFEFWLAQRNVTLASFRDDVMLERSYRCQYAHWRVQKHYGQLSSASGKVAYAHGRQRSRSRSPPWSRNGDELERKQYRPRSTEKNLVHQGESQSYRVSSTPESSRFYDVRRRVSRRYDDGKNRENEGCSKNCERKWADLNRRVKELERIVSRLDWPNMSALNSKSASPYETNGELQSPRDDSSPTCIDLTDDIEVELDTSSDPIQTKANDDTASPDGNHATQSRSVEITPTDSDTHHDGALTAGDMEEPITEPMGDIELKSPPELMSLINAYDQLNDQVAVKQREEQKVVADMESMIDEDETSSVELRSQIYALRDSIKKEKDKRDIAIAAIIVHARTENRKELEQEFGKGARLGVASEQDDLHEKCADIAAKLAEKEKVLARLQKQLQSLSSLPVSTEESGQALGEREAQELLSKIGLERASRTSLETERQKIFTRLMKSSLRIQALVTKELRRKHID